MLKEDWLQRNMQPLHLWLSLASRHQQRRMPQRSPSKFLQTWPHCQEPLLIKVANSIFFHV